MASCPRLSWSLLQKRKKSSFHAGWKLVLPLAFDKFICHTLWQSLRVYLMKKVSAILSCVGLLLVFAAPIEAADPDSQYLAIYDMIQEGDRLQTGGHFLPARQKYIQAQAALKEFHRRFPAWNVQVVRFRLGYLDDRIGGAPRPGRDVLEAARSSAAAEIEHLGIDSSPSPDRSMTPSPDARDRQIQALTEEVRRLQSERQTLQEKLKEALSAKPAVMDPRELRKAERRIRDLEKEKEVLEAALRRKEGGGVEAGTLEELRKSLTAANQQIEKQTEIARTLAQEKEIIQDQLNRALEGHLRARNLEEENGQLRQQLAQAGGNPQLTPSVQRLQLELVESRAEVERNAEELLRLRSDLESLQEERTALEREKAEMERQLAKLTRSAGNLRTRDSRQVRHIERQRDELQRKLNETARRLYDNRAERQKIERQTSEDELAGLQARLEALEAQKAPYSPEELALLRPPAPKMISEAPAEIPLIAEVEEKRKGGNDAAPQQTLPEGAAVLLGQAHRAFAQRQFEVAEEHFQQVLEQSGDNVAVLLNLATTQIHQGRLKEAGANLKKALDRAPNNPDVLAIMGLLKFEEEQLEEAMSFLSRAAKIDPNNAETQNYLGITLAQLGHRAAAETAFRRAIQVAPGYGAAHNNLAMIYATQIPPLSELARWHYQRALASGHPRDAQLEKRLDNTQSQNTP
jgi:Flp pilus assembly protein TadD